MGRPIGSTTTKARGKDKRPRAPFALVASTHDARLGDYACGADGLVEAVRLFRNDELYLLAELPDISSAACVIGNTVDIDGRGEEGMEA